MEVNALLPGGLLCLVLENKQFLGFGGELVMRFSIFAEILFGVLRFWFHAMSCALIFRPPAAFKTAIACAKRSLVSLAG